MATTFAGPQIKRADLLLLALLALGQQESPLTRVNLERALARLASDDQVGSWFRPYYRQAMLHGAVIETLAYLETNHLIESNFAVSATGRARIAQFAPLQREVERAVTAAHSTT